MLDALTAELLKGAYTPDTPAALVYKASWPEERTIRCTLKTLAESARAAGITKTALVLVGDFLGSDYERSRLYDPDFTTGYRKENTHED
jgi:precorrin-4/cobalt-precorrin-4 C11-methyltransferase